MANGIFLGFDFGYKRIGVAVGQSITGQARPLETLSAFQGRPSWSYLEKIIHRWQPKALIVGLPTHIDDSEQHTTKAAKNFAKNLEQHYSLPVYLEDERLSTVEARAQLFALGGYKKIKSSAVDSVAACVILEQFLSNLERVAE